MRHRLLRWSGLTPMAHRPPLPPRFGLYCAVAFLAPSLMLQLVPASVVPYRDLVWLVTLLPAFLLSLHYGMRGAVAGLLMGTVLFTTIQLLVALRHEPEDWRITVPIYTAYGAIAISVGWLSQRLHLFYERAKQAARAVAVRQVAIAIQHEVNNALATVLAEADLLLRDTHLIGEEDRRSVTAIADGSRRIAESVMALAPVTVAEH